MNILYLSRRNLLTLLSKLDGVKAGEQSTCSIIKQDGVHPVYPSSPVPILITALEDEEYYTDRPPGYVLPLDIPR